MNHNTIGRSFEFAFLLELSEAIGKFRKIKIIKNNPFCFAQKEWFTLPKFQQIAYRQSLRKTIDLILELEPNLKNNLDDILNIYINEDKKGEEGDSRDVILKFENTKWEIGFNLKKNNVSFKHSRLSNKIDFGQRWYGINCSENYWNDIRPIFANLEKEQEKQVEWKSLQNKQETIYLPLLSAFSKEFLTRYYENKSIIKNLIEYIVGKRDFYQIISFDSDHNTKIKCFNLHNELSQNNQYSRIKLSKFPTKILSFKFKQNSLGTIELKMNNNWHINFRIHNVSRIVEPSLKFDIKLINTPNSVKIFNQKWN